MTSLPFIDWELELVDSDELPPLKTESICWKRSHPPLASALAAASWRPLAATVARTDSESKRMVYLTIWDERFPDGSRISRGNRTSDRISSRPQGKADAGNAVEGAGTQSQHNTQEIIDGKVSTATESETDSKYQSTGGRVNEWKGSNDRGKRMWLGKLKQ